MEGDLQRELDEGRDRYLWGLHERSGLTELRDRGRNSVAAGLEMRREGHQDPVCLSSLRPLIRDRNGPGTCDGVKRGPQKIHHRVRGQPLAEDQGNESPEDAADQERTEDQ